MAIKANASAQGADFKKYVGVASFRVLGVNPTKEELEKFFGREISKEPEYIKKKVDEKNNKEYVQARVTFMIQADDPETVAQVNPLDKESAKTNKALKTPYKTTVTFFIDSRYMYSQDKDKYQVMDKYARTAWVTADQCRNHQIPVYANGPAKLDAEYHPVFHGEDALTQFIINYLNVTPIDSYNKNTGQWITNPHPEDCEANLYKIKDYFKGDFSELKEYCVLMPTNYVKLCVGVQTDDQGRQYNTVYSGMSLRNGSSSYTRLKDAIEGDSYGTKNTVFSDDSAGIITNIHEYEEVVKETDFGGADDPFASNASSGDDNLPFGDAGSDTDPFASMN